LQEFGEFHGRAWAGAHLARNRIAILPQDVGAPAAVETAGGHIEQDIHFPGLECVARERPTHDASEEALEPVEHQLQLREAVRLHVTGMIGGRREQD
jgi:hypothetical protein